ncbi:MAG TPA: HEAT repeat domain-containing protein [Polyangiaceae bacterium]|nr:HEAT repeat domain-containing protein [Polyangiaceae bacterium]
MRRLGLAALLVGSGFAAAPPVSAEPAADVDHLVRNLTSGADFRIRTQAALALGASKSRRAVEPLCTGLVDTNATVRAASAAALGRLRMGGTECLQKRLSNESSETVKSAIVKALDPVFSPETKYYVAIGKISDKTGRGGDEVDGIVYRAMAGAAASLPVFTLAPPGESVTDAKRRLSGHSGVKPVFLSPRVPVPDYSGGNLTIRIEVAMFSYPDKSLLGSYTTKLTQQGVSSPDKETEDELIRDTATRAFEKFTVAAARLP